VEVLYYECHVTIDPVFGERLDAFADLCRAEQFRPAKLLMQKQREATPTVSDKDTFATGHGREYADIAGRMNRLVEASNAAGFFVRRYKIEAVVFDQRCSRNVTQAMQPDR
jgi:hypothetical protein